MERTAPSACRTCNGWHERVHGEPLIVLHSVQFQEVAIRTTIGVARFDVFEAPFTVALGT